MKNIKIKINGKSIECSPEKTILQAARENGIYIPALCEHPDLPHKANCRVCVVEVKGINKLVTSCSVRLQDGMEINTETARVKRSRNLNLEFIYAEHVEKCVACVWRFNCTLLHTAKKYQTKIARFKDRKGSRSTHKFSSAVEIDGTQCIDCRNCIDACSLIQNISYLELAGKGIEQEIVPTDNNKIDCIYCGQCALHCPVSSAQEQTHWQQVETAIKAGKTVVAQFSSSVKISLGEEFGLPDRTDVGGKAVAAMRQLGFAFVFDMNLSNGIVARAQALELLKKRGEIKTDPIFSSGCPAWVKYVEFYYPKLKSHLSGIKSPQIVNGRIIKNDWAKRNKINTSELVVVSVVPCTAQKHEMTKSETQLNGDYPVDFVLTLRELAFMIKKNNIDFGKLKNSDADELGASEKQNNIFEASGGETELILKNMDELPFEQEVAGSKIKELRKLTEIKEINVKIGGKEYRFAAVNGIANAKKALKNMYKYDYIEVRACPTGCTGGGGQVIPTTQEKRANRFSALHRISRDNKQPKKSKFYHMADNKELKKKFLT